MGLAAYLFRARGNTTSRRTAPWSILQVSHLGRSADCGTGSIGQDPILISAPGVYLNPRISPDGQYIAYMGERASLWTYDIARQSGTRLARGGVGHVWSPDGKHIAFSVRGDAQRSFMWVRSDGAKEPVEIPMECQGVPTSFSPDGKELFINTLVQGTGLDVAVVPLDLSDPDHPKTGAPKVIVNAQENERHPRFSPDGRWIVYQTGDATHGDIVVRPYQPGSANDIGRFQIAEKGAFPQWSPDGKPLYFETADNRIHVVPISFRGDSIVPGKVECARDARLQDTTIVANFSVMPDGKRLLAIPRWRRRRTRKRKRAPCT